MDMSKKSFGVILAALTALGAVQLAHAYDIVALAIAIPLEAGIEVTALIVAPTATTDASGSDDKSVYFSELRDEAVEQIAEGTVPSALLSDAFTQIREQTGTQASDQELALAVIRAIQ